jgi:hypothetical protein
MGGYGSGQWYRGGSKTTVEDSWSLDINWMTREGIFDVGWSIRYHSLDRSMHRRSAVQRRLRSERE